MITDIDKDSHNRGYPTPNTHDALERLSLSAKGTNSTNYVTPASDTSTLTGAKNGQFTIVQVKSFTTTDSYTTNNPGAGLYGTTNFTLYTQPHGLSTTPTIIGFEQSTAGEYTPLPLTKFASGTTTTALWYNFNAFVDNTQVGIFLSTLSYGDFTATFTPGFIFKWYLMLQVANI